MKNHRKSEECTKIKMIHIQRLVVFVSIALCGALLFMNINGDNLEKEEKKSISEIYEWQIRTESGIKKSRETEIY